MLLSVAERFRRSANWGAYAEYTYYSLVEYTHQQEVLPFDVASMASLTFVPAAREMRVEAIKLTTRAMCSFCSWVGIVGACSWHSLELSSWVE